MLIARGKLLGLVLSVLSIPTFSTPAAAEVALDLSPFRYDTERPEVLTLRGEIGERAGFRFKHALQRFPSITTLELMSPGGAVYIALPMAYDIHNAKLKTVIPRGSSCASACSFLFFAGTERFADGLLGVHQVSSDVDDNIDTQITVGDIAAAFDAFGVPASVLSRMLRTPPNEMHWYQPSELAALGILGTSSPTRQSGGEAPGHDPRCAAVDPARANVLSSAPDAVRLYYADLASRRVGCAESRWLDPPKDLAESVVKFVDASLTYNALNRERSTNNRAIVDVVAHIATTDGARTKWTVEIALVPTRSGWKIEEMSGAPSEDGSQAPGKQTDAMGCTTVNAARHNQLGMATEIVRLYYADLAARRAECAKARWLQAPADLGDRVMQFVDASLSYNEIDWDRSSENRAVVSAVAHISTTDGKKSAWRVELLLVPSAAGWKIEEMSGYLM